MNELTTTSAGPPATVSTLDAAALAASLTHAAADPNCDPSKMQAIYDVVRQVRADAAKEAFYADLSGLQGEMQPVIRDADNPQTKSKYARFETIQVDVRPHERKYGFSISYDVKTVDDKVSVGARLAHRLGHSELFGPIIERRDMTGAKGAVNKTELHGFGSTTSYLKRYLVAAIYNIPLVGDDDDGNAGGGVARHHGDTNGAAPNNPPRKQAASNLPEPIARDPNSWLGKTEATIDKAPDDNAWIKCHKAAAERCPTIEDLNNLEDDFARAVTKAPPAVSTPIRAAWAAARKRLTPVDRQTSTNTDTSTSAPSNEAAKSDTPADPPGEYVLADEFGDAMGAYATALEFAREFIDLWRIADDREALAATNEDTITDARTDPAAAKILSELGMADDDPLLLTVPVPVLPSGKQDWVGYRQELRKSLRDATDVAAWFAAQRETLTGASKAVQQLAAKELTGQLTDHDPAPGWLVAFLPKATAAKPPASSDAPRKPEDVLADSWIADMDAMPISADGRGHFDQLTRISKDMQTKMMLWMRPLEKGGSMDDLARFKRVNDVATKKREALEKAGF